jgi:DNA topoisomerase-2
MERVNARWEVGVAAAPEEEGFSQLSFVNSIYTLRGGSHVQYLADQVVKYLVHPFT